MDGWAQQLGTTTQWGKGGGNHHLPLCGKGVDPQGIAQLPHMLLRRDAQRTLLLIFPLLTILTPFQGNTASM
jgi:hypothetical protein